MYLKSSYAYDLPSELIAQHPLPCRTQSRLLVVEGNEPRLHDVGFTHIIDWLEPGDVLVFNNTRVIPARLHGVKSTGGRIEVLVERVLDTHTILAHIRASKAPRDNSLLILESGINARVSNREGDLFVISILDETPVIDLLFQYGHIPLPPYIKRMDEQTDHERYQTIYSKSPGAIAAPTAGLHFDHALMTLIRAKGIHTVEVTLHVGSGTFQPLRVENLDEHQMHEEFCEISQEAVALINQVRANGGRIIAVGTTAVRCLETASQTGELQAYSGYTNIFIRPGYTFKSVDGLITNFHLPESTLLALVSAFAGYEVIRQAYQHAISQQYRFFSYGDAMALFPSVSRAV